jgi:DNA-binding phage protein
MATETLPFDAARTIASATGQAELLADAMASGDARYIANALGVIARVRGMLPKGTTMVFRNEYHPMPGPICDD